MKKAAMAFSMVRLVAMRKEVTVAVTIAAATGIAAVLWYRRGSHGWKRAKRIVMDFKEECDTPLSRLWDVADAMAVEMHTGLATGVGGNCCLRMLLSPTPSFPNGNEKGLYYGLGLGRTKVRLYRVQLGGKDVGLANKELTEVPVPINLMVSNSEELYNYLAAQLAKFISSSHSSISGEKPKEIGITFSFPVHTSELQEVHVEWNKGFSIKENGGKDALTMLNEAMKKHGLDIRVSSLVNDTVATLIGGRYCNSDTVASVILGDGTNAAYWEPLESVPKWHGPQLKHGQMAINIEWGDFVSAHLPITDFDVQLDADSPRTGEQIFEKLISGMYLGDIVRRVLLKLAEETNFFEGSVPLKLRIPFALRTPDVASMHEDTSANLHVVTEILDKALGIHDTTWRMRRVVVDICDTVTKRAARLACAGIVGILKKLGRDGTDKKAVVVVNGGLYEHYRLFRNYIQCGIKEMLQDKCSDNVTIEQWSDICGLGTALLSVPNSRM